MSNPNPNPNPNPNRPTTSDYAPSWSQCNALDIAESCPERLTDAIEWLQKVLELIPEDCRPSARLEVEVEDDELYVRYVRPMNDTEFESYRQSQQWQERQERETLARLIAKYGVPSGS